MKAVAAELKKVALRFWTRLWAAVERFQEDGCFQLAAAVSYYAALSFFPLLLILTSGFGYLLQSTGWGQDAREQLVTFVSEQGSEALASRVDEALNEVHAGAAVSGPIGVVTLLVGAMLIFAQFEQAFDRVWNVESSGNKSIAAKLKQILWRRLRAFLMLLGVGGMIGAAFVAGIVLSGMSAGGDELFDLPWWLRVVLQLVVTMGFNWLMFTLVYRLLPKVPVRWSEAAHGAVLAAISWELGRQILAAVLISDKYSAYGVIGSFIAIMLWVYYGTIITFVGAEYVQVICTDCDENTNDIHDTAATRTSETSQGR